jgi:hypothetical protein
MNFFSNIAKAFMYNILNKISKVMEIKAFDSYVKHITRSIIIIEVVSLKKRARSIKIYVTKCMTKI